MKKIFNAIIVLIAFHSNYSIAQEVEETVVVTSAFIDTSEINNPFMLLMADEFTESSHNKFG